jgi:hypothetical protein
MADSFIGCVSLNLAGGFLATAIEGDVLEAGHEGKLCESAA